MDTRLLLIYCMTIFTASMIPGPSSMLALAQGARYGIWAGTLSGIGNAIASICQAAIALLAITQIGNLSTSTLAIIKYIGAAYIIYIGIGLLKVESFSHPNETRLKGDSPNSLSHVWNGFSFAIFNPKAITFFAAFFPQFIDQGTPTQPQIIAIFAPIALIAFICFIFYAIAGHALMKVMDRTRHIGKIFGGLIIGAGILMLL